MKCLLVLCLIGLIRFSEANPRGHDRGCLYILGHCAEECPEGTHAYTTGCKEKTPEPTCKEPNPVAERGALCDYSACYCDPPTVRHTETKKCVTLDQCPKAKPKAEQSQTKY